MKTIALVIIVFLFAAQNLYAGGGWPQPKGHLYLKLNQWWIIYDQYYSETGSILKDRTRSIGNTSIYSEYGITDRLTGIIYFPFFSKATLYTQQNSRNGSIIEQGDQVFSVGDAEVTLKYGIVVDKPVVVSVSAMFGVPLGIANGGYDGSLQTGDGEFNQMARVDVSGSVSIGSVFPYFSTYFGYNNRTQGFSDEYQFGVQLGLELGKFTFISRVNGVRSLKNGSFEEQLVGTNISGNNTEYLIFSPEIIFNIQENWGITINMVKPLSGKLFFAEPSYSIGVFLDI